MLTGTGAPGRAVRGIAAACTLACVACDDQRIRAAQDALSAEDAFDFGAVSLGRSRRHVVRLRNLGIAPASLADPVLDQSGTSFAAHPVAARLSAGDWALIPVDFTPADVDSFSATLRIAGDGATPELKIRLTGRGVLGRADIRPQKLDFGRIAVRTTASLAIELVNIADTDADVVVPLPSGPDADFFQVGATGDVVVPAGATILLPVTFLPQRIGPHAAAIALQPCPSCAAEPVDLVGEGIAATLVVDPLAVDFGVVKTGDVQHRQVLVRNAGSLAATLHEVVVDPGSGAGFAVAPVALPVVLAQDQTQLLEVTFSPASSGPQTGALHIRSDARGSEDVVVALRGSGGGPKIAANPNPLFFPRSGLGMPVSKRVVVRNVGNDPNAAMPLVVTGYEVLPGSPQFTVNGPALPLNLAPGVQAVLNVVFVPSSEDVVAGTLRLLSNDATANPLDVKLGGSGQTLGPCDWSVIPERLDFGSIPIGTRARLGFQLRNVGSRTCQFSNVRREPGTSPAFAPEDMSARLVAPGAALFVPVEFEPDRAGTFKGAVLFDTSSQTAPQGRVELLGGGAPACLVLTPAVLEFGTVGLLCEPPVKSVSIANACGLPVTLGAPAIGLGGDEYSVAGGGARTLQPGDQLRLDVTYRPVNEGEDAAPLYVQTSLATAPYVVSLDGTGAQRSTYTDHYQEPPIPKVDFLFVVDNSGSFAWHQDALANNFDGFIQTAVARGVDFQIAVTTTGLVPWTHGLSDCPGGVDGGEDGRFFPVDHSRPRILTPQTPRLRQTFNDNVHVGTCHWNENALEAARRALSPPLVDNADDPRYPERDDGNLGFLRPDADLYVLYVTDSDDLSGIATATFIEHLRGLKPGRADMVHASGIVGLPTCAQIDGVGTRIMEVVNAMNGLVGDVCDPDWGGILQRIGADAFKPHDTFPLSHLPDGRDIRVTVDGVDVPQTAADGSANWRFDPTIGDNGAVVFTPGSVPGANQKIDVTYPIPCPALRP